MKKFFIILFAVLFFIFIDIRLIEPNLLFVKNKTLYIPNWSDNLNGLKVALVSDLHIGSHFVNLKKLDKIVEKTNKKNPDYIFLLGDFDGDLILNAGYKKEDVAEKLSKFKGKEDVISILGNHDEYQKQTVRDILKLAKIPVLEDSNITVSHNGTKIKIAGFQDLYFHKTDYNKTLGKNNKEPVIALAHNPDIFYDMPEYVSVTLSGHTHGGEIYLPFIGSFFVPSKYGQKYRKGYIVENNKHLYVTGGIASLSRMRFLNPPEIAILTFYNQDEKHKIENTKIQKGINKDFGPPLIKSLRKIKQRLLSK